MTQRGQRSTSRVSGSDGPLGRAALWAVTLGAMGYLLLADYKPMVLVVLTAMFFGAYLWMRVMVYLDNDRFSPRRLRVGITWALIGIDRDTDEYDIRPVRIYFLLLAMLFCGLLLRPILRWMVL